MPDVSADDMVAEGVKVPEGCLAMSVIVVIQYYNPNGGTSSERGPWLAWRRDTDTPAWTALGMLDSCAGDLRRDLARGDDD